MLRPPDVDTVAHRERPTVRSATTADIPEILAFLERYLDTSIYLLWNLTELGISATSSPMSGNFLLVEVAGRIEAVFCPTRKGDLLAQAGGRVDGVEAIVNACAREPFPTVGVLAEWTLAEALWRPLAARPGFSTVYHCKSVVYRLDRPLTASARGEPVVVRALGPSDYHAWDPVDRAFHEEEGLTVVSDAARRLAGYRLCADVNGWWGAFAGAELVSTACLNAVYAGVGQVGGVYTRPAFRRRGLARRVMAELMGDHAARNGLRALVLFAAERNYVARTMYTAMGFAERGRFGLLFGRQAP